jgi:large subunit ribosomal protein L29
MKAADLREKSSEDLQELQKTLTRDVFQNRLKNFTNRLDDTSAIRKTRRDLARVITVLREKGLGLTPAAAPSQAAEPEAAPAKPKKAPKVEAKAAAPVEAEAKPKKAAVKSADTASEGAEPAAAPKKKPSTKAKKSEAK